jgi:hypothetical protein
VICVVLTFAGTQVGPAVGTFSAHDAERTIRVQQFTEAILVVCLPTR